MYFIYLKKIICANLDGWLKVYIKELWVEQKNSDYSKRMELAVTHKNIKTQVMRFITARNNKKTTGSIK